MKLVTSIVLIGAGLLAGCVSPYEPTPTPMTFPLQTSRWFTISQPQPYPIVNEGNTLTFAFPAAGSVHYLYTEPPDSIIRGTVSVTLRVSTADGAVFNSLDTTNCGIAPSVRPFFWSNGAGSHDNDRWWSNPRAFTLANGTTTITVPLVPEAWSNVSGKFGNADPEIKYAFEKALTNVTRFGLTFGGGCSFGHGVNVSNGSATFTLTDYSIQ
jgi:hypothetical protein